jgi:hypothetical protein
MPSETLDLARMKKAFSTFSPPAHPQAAKKRKSFLFFDNSVHALLERQ